MIGGGAALVSGAAFITSLASPDGSSRHHFLTREHAEAYVSRYNEELLSAAPPPHEPTTQGWLVKPSLAPGFIGVSGTF